ncbi:MAG: TonB-dependent receptor [Myxococcales bacterium]|nr:TonB-dependent receptor [Myxococcales bacterium]
MAALSPPRPPSLREGGLFAAVVACVVAASPALAQDSGGVPKGESGVIKKDETPTEAPQDKRQPPKARNFVQPDYPPEAKEKGLEGQVTLQLDIDVTGKVTGAVVVDPAGNGFDEAALAAAQKLEFTPATRANGQPAPSRILYRFTFKLDEKQPGAEPGPGTTQPEQGEPKQALRGVVLGVSGAGKGEEVPLAGATVVLTPAGGAPRTLITGADGAFSFDDLPVGKAEVKISAEGFDGTSLTEDLAEGEETQVKYRVFVSSTGLEVTVRGERPPREVVKRTVTKREIDRIPGTNGDALRSLINLPGVARPPAIAGILLVRGSGPQDTQTFIDGTPVPLIYHFGGLSSVVPTEILDKIDFFPGNFGAEYGRVTGGIVDVGLRSPKDDGYHGMLQTDLVDTRGLVEGPFPGTKEWTFLVAGRRSYLDAWLGPTLEAAGASVTQAPVYYDYQLLIEHNSANVGRLRVGFFGSDDALELLVNEPSPNEPALTGNVGLHTAFQRLQVLHEKDIGERDRIRSVVGFGHDEFEFGLGPLFFNLDVLSLNTRAEWSHRFSKEVRFNAGMDVFSGNATVNLRIPQPNAQPGEPSGGPFSTRTFIDLESTQSYCFPALYTELELEPAKGVRIVPGMRVDYTSINSSFDFSPRVSGRFDLTHEFPKTTLKSGLGLYHQPPAFQQIVEPIGNPELKSNRAVHYALGLEQEITKQIDGSVEGFVKQLDSVVVGASAADNSGVSYDNRGLGYVVGSEFLLRYKPDDRFFGWVAYTLSRSVRQNGPGEPEYLVNFDQTHILTMLGSYQLGHGWEIGARFRLVSGNLIDPNVCNPDSEGCSPTRINSIYNAPSGAYVAIPLGNNTERLPFFHALDLRVDKRWKFKYWQFSTYLDVQNVYNNQNPEAVGYNFNYTAREYVNGLPILPSIGIRADF